MTATVIIRWPLDDTKPEQRHTLEPGANLGEALMRIAPDRWGGMPFALYYGAVTPEGLSAVEDAVEIEVKAGDIWHVQVMPAEAFTIGALVAAGVSAATAAAIAPIIVYAATMAISMALSFAASMLLAPGKQSSAATAPNDQPTGLNSLTAPRNQIRPLGRIPEVYGQMRHWPDLLFPAWSSWTPVDAHPMGGHMENKNTTARQDVVGVYCIGRGRYALSDYRFADSPISSVNGTVLHYPPGAVLPDWVRLPRPIENFTAIQLEEKPDAWTPWFRVPGSSVSEIWFQFAWSGGLYQQIFSGAKGPFPPATYEWGECYIRIEFQRLNEAGQVVDFYEYVYGQGSQSRNELRVTWKLPITPGRWQVRLRHERLGSSDPSYEAHRVTRVEGIVGFERLSEAHRTYSDETILVVMANNRGDAVSQNLEKFNCVATRILPHQDWKQPPGVFGPATPTRLWLSAVTHTLTDPQTCGYAVEQVDWQSVLDVYFALEKMGEGEFNATIDRVMSADEQLQLLARKARAQVFISGGLVTFARDERRPGVSAIFNRRNRLQDRSATGLGLRFPGPDEHDGVEIEWVDAANEWKRRTYTYPENVSLRNPLRIDLVGATHWREIFRRARYEYALLRYRRRSQPLRVTEEAQLLMPFDRVGVVHPWDEGVSDGEVVAVNGLKLTLDRPLLPGLGADARIRLRAEDGRSTALLEFTPAGERDVVLKAPAPFPILAPTPDRQIGTLYNVSARDAVERATHWLVTGAEIDDAAVTLTLMDDDDRVYAESDDVPVPPNPPILQTY